MFICLCLRSCTQVAHASCFFRLYVALDDEFGSSSSLMKYPLAERIATICCRVVYILTSKLLLNLAYTFVKVIDKWYFEICVVVGWPSHTSVLHWDCLCLRNAL